MSSPVVIERTRLEVSPAKRGADEMESSFSEQTTAMLGRSASTASNASGISTYSSYAAAGPHSPVRKVNRARDSVDALQMRFNNELSSYVKWKKSKGKRKDKEPQKHWEMTIKTCFTDDFL